MVLAFVITLSLLAANFEREGNKLANEGDKLFQGGKYDQAAGKYRKAYDKFQKAIEEGKPIEQKSDKMIKNLMAAYYRAKDYDNLIWAYTKHLEKNPNDIKSVKTLAILYKKFKKNAPKAIEILVNADKNVPNYILRKKAADYYAELKDYKNALKWYRKAFDLRQDPKVLKNIATLYIKLDNKEKAIETYRNFIKTDPDKNVLERVYKYLGKLYEDINQRAKAKEYYKKSNSLDFDDNLTLKIIVMEYEDQNYSEAMKYVNLLHKKEPGEETGIYYKALIYYDQGKLKEAKNEFKKLKNSRKYAVDAKKWIESIDSEL